MTTSTLSLGYDCPEEQAADSRWSSLAVTLLRVCRSRRRTRLCLLHLSWRNGVQMIWKKMMTIATQLTKTAAVRRYGTPAMCTIA